MHQYLFLFFLAISFENCLAFRTEWEQFKPSELSTRTSNGVWASAESQRRPSTTSLDPIQLDIPAISGRLEPNKMAIKALLRILGNAKENKKYFDYAPTCGLLEAKNAIAGKYGLRDPSTNVLLTQPGDVFMTTGASHALQLAIQAIADPGDNILVPMPGWQYYRVLAQFAGIEARAYGIRFEREDESEVDLEQMRSRIDDKTRAILVNNPTNPHGEVLSRAQLEGMLRVAEEYKLPIISDETFQGMLFDGAVRFHPLTSLQPKVPIIACDGIGKRYLLPGWRVGWLIVHDHAGVLAKVRQGMHALCQLINGPATILQAVVPTILTKSQQSMFDVTNGILAKNAKLLHARLGQIPGFKPFMPQAGWFIAVEIDTSLYSIDVNKLVEELKAEMNLRLLPGDIFGMENWVRIALVVSEKTLIETCDRIAALSAKYYAPIVSTKQGPVQGFTVLDGTVAVFLGIPYAKAPEGNLRFEEPERPEPREGILEAKEHKRSCFLHADPDWLTDLLYGQNNAKDQTEDCLYLNIFTTAKRKANVPLLPVMFIIHGGGFEMGTSRQYSIPDDIGTNFVRHGILVVNIQYRLGQLGFASTGDGVMPGNLGLWDQNAALKWVHENIEQFGGDPEQITLFGHSAGAGSVSAHSLSPHSRDLFIGAIQMSGSAFSNWMYGSRVAEETLKLAKALKCEGDSMAIKECLKNVDPIQVQKVQTKIGPTRNEPNPGLYQARFDGHFFPEPPVQLALTAPPKRTLLSFTKLESAAFTLVTNGPDGSNSNLFDTALKWSELGNFGLDQLHEFIRHHVATGQHLKIIKIN